MGDEKITKERLLHDHYFHEADRMNQRTDWFLIFHAILMEAFFSIHRHETSSIIAVGSLGLVLSCLWMISGIRATRMAWQLGKLIRDEKGEAKETHEKIFSERKTINANSLYGWSRFLPLYGIVIPGIFVIIWTVLLVLRAGQIWFILLPCLIVGSLILLALVKRAIPFIESKLNKD
jgi:hypothetical protein